MAYIKKVKRPWMREKERKQGYTNSEFYQSTRWRKLRNRFMSASENQLCVHCQQKGLLVPATECDHIVPIKSGGGELDYNNLQPLCSSCHARKSAKERG